jgi:hypothetical protein
MAVVFSARHGTKCERDEGLDIVVASLGKHEFVIILLSRGQ